MKHTSTLIRRHKRYPILLIIFPTLLFNPIIAFADSTDNPIKPSVAILDFANVSIDKQLSNLFTERFRAELSRHNVFTIIEREMINKILQEQSLQISGATSDSGATRLGQLLNAKYVILGSVGRISNSQFIATCRLVSVESGEIRKEVSEQLSGNENTLFNKGALNLSKKLAYKNVETTSTLFFSKGILIVEYSPDSINNFGWNRALLKRSFCLFDKKLDRFFSPSSPLIEKDMITSKGPLRFEKELPAGSYNFILSNNVTRYGEQLISSVQIGGEYEKTKLKITEHFASGGSEPQHIVQIIYE